MAINKTVNSKGLSTHVAMRNCIEYVLRDFKIEDGFVDVLGPYEYSEINWDNVYQSFLREKQIWNKDCGRMYAHNVISFHKDEMITPGQAFDFANEFAEHWFKNYQTLIAVHTDKSHIHVHFVTNTVSYVDGAKYHVSRLDLQAMKDFTNVMCVERGFHVEEKNQHFDGTPFQEGEITSWDKNKYHLLSSSRESFVAACGLAVMKALEYCQTKDEFIRRMLAQGWQTIWEERKKHITFKDCDGRKVRDTNLKKSFNLDVSKEGLEYEFERQRISFAGGSEEYRFRM